MKTAGGCTYQIENIMNYAKQFPVKTGLLLLTGFFLLSIWMINQYAEKERNRDIMNWQSRISILADMRTAAVIDYLDKQKKLLNELATNPSLQLYLTQYKLSDGKDDEILRAQLSHVRNLIRATANRFGFDIARLDSVNTEHHSLTPEGLAVLDENGSPLLSTKGFIKDFSEFNSIIDQSLIKSTEQLLNISLQNGNTLFGFVMPVFNIQRVQIQQPVGAVMILLSTSDLYQTLKNLHLDTETDETLLVERRDNSIVYLSPLQGEFNILHQLALNNDNLAASHASQNIGDFALKTDYQGKQVLVTGRQVKNTPWTLIQKIDADEALAESNKHQRFLVTTFSLITLLIMVLLVAVWRHSTSVRLQKLASALETRTALLNAVSDNINEHIFLVDENNDFVFANLSLANCLGIQAEDFRGKNMASVVGPDVASNLRSLSCENDMGSLPCIINLPLGNDDENIYHVSTVTLANGEYQDAKLYVLHDITSLKNAQEKRDHLARGIITTLVKAVDLHDPFCVDHSERTREVAIGIARELHLDDSRCESLEMAALLANIGKLFVPKEILIKMEPLSEEENELLKKHIEYAADILKQLTFEGPVVEIISQKNEYLDGSGYPQGLKADDILLESRILAVANAFVAMASSRAYREGRPIKEVIDILLQQSDSKYDRHVVAALFHIAENKTDWHKWQVART